MNTEQANKLIADFEGLRWHENGTVSNYPSSLNMKMGVDTIEDLKYHTSWDWLMPVVDSIESLKFWVRICLSSCYIDNCNTPEFEEIIMVDADSKIEAVWQAVVEFIQWYNQNSK